MATTHVRTTLRNSARKLSKAQIAAGFGGKRRQSAQKAARKTARKKKSGAVARTNKAHSHRPRTKPRKSSARKASRPQKANWGKVVSYSLPKEQAVATKANRGKKRKSSKGHAHRKTKTNGRRSSRRNISMGGIPGLVTNAVFVIAGAVGSKYATQMILNDKNTGVMGYIGNLVAAFGLSWAVKAFMKNEKAASAVLAGGIVQVVLRLIADYTPFGQYTKNLGMGDYLTQIYSTPQHLKPVGRNWAHSAELTMTPTAGLSGCNDLYGTNSLYSAA